MSRLENDLKVTVLTQSANFVLPDTLKVTGSTISTPKSYDEHVWSRVPPGFKTLQLAKTYFRLLQVQRVHAFACQNLLTSRSYHINYYIGFVQIKEINANSE